MPDPKRLLPTIGKAVDAFQNTPGRSGRWIDLVGATEVLVVGDLHGNVDNFSRALRKADLGKNSTRHLVLQEVVHGKFSYPMGGDKSHQLLDLVAALKCQFPRQVHFLMGNHELSQWQSRAIGKGDDTLNDLFIQGIEEAYSAAAGEVYEAYLRLFAVMPFAIRTANRVFLSHSLPRASRLAEFNPQDLKRDEITEVDCTVGGALHSIVWGREVSDTNVRGFLAKVDADFLISGHIPCEKGHSTPNSRQIILDSMAAPACFCLFPTDRQVTFNDLLAGIGFLNE